MAKEKPKTQKELAALARQVAAKGQERRFRESGLSRDEFDARELVESAVVRNRLALCNDLLDLGVVDVYTISPNYSQPETNPNGQWLEIPGNPDGLPFSEAAMVKRKRAAVMWWQAMRWTPPFGPSLPGYLYRDDESVPAGRADAGAAPREQGDADAPVDGDVSLVRRTGPRRDGAEVVPSRHTAMPALRAALVTAVVEQVRAHRAHQSSYFHRCPRCCVRCQLDAHQGGKLVKLRRPDTCAGCAAPMAKGDSAHGFSRWRWRVAERVRVCDECFSEWATSRGVADRG